MAEKRWFADTRDKEIDSPASEGNRVLDAAARFLGTLPSQVLLQPRGEDRYEQPKHDSTTNED
jgi:hypothetical protein